MKMNDLDFTKVILPMPEQPISTVRQFDDYISSLVYSGNCAAVDSLMRYACIDGYKYPASAAPKIDENGWHALNSAHMLDGESIAWLNSLPIKTQAFLVELAEEIYFASPAVHKESEASNA